MITLLCEMNRIRKGYMEQGASVLPAEIVREYEEKYFTLLEEGRAENKETSHKYAKQEEKTLLNRMEKYSHNHLLFLHDFAVPFDDNISERDLRKVKNRQKKVIYGYTGYILAGVKPIELIKRLNCYLFIFFTFYYRYPRYLFMQA